MSKGKTKHRVALVSPSASAVSETFIQAHKAGLTADVFHYFNGHLPTELEGQGKLLKHDMRSRLLRKFKMSDSPMSLDETALLDSLKSNRIELVIAEYGPTGAQVTKVCQKANIPLVVHFHGYDASQYDILDKYSIGYREMFDFASSIVVVSQRMREMLMDLGASENKIVLAPCTPDPTFLEIERTSSSDFSFLFIGRFVDKKAPYYTLLAFNELLRSGRQARLVMAGTGPLLNATKNISTALGIASHVEFLGAIDHQKVKKLMSSSDCYVQHSIRAENGDMEGTPVAVMEAGASGLPVISTVHGGIPDVIKHGETGFLVEEHDMKAMAEYMMQLVDQPSVGVKMGSDSRAFFREFIQSQSSSSILDQVVLKAIG